MPFPKILLVEDDTALAQVYQTRLQAEGYQVSRAADGEAALAGALKELPDLIVLDLMMPKISGLDVLDILRRTPEVANTKIIVLTALDRPEGRQRAQELGADDYLVKSQISLDEVIKRVSEHLGAQP